MEFGLVPSQELIAINFALPVEHKENKKILLGKRIKDPKLYIGCAKWGIPEWIGKIYPPGTREKNFLDHYVRLYNCVELNTTHYKIYGPVAISKWAAKVTGKDFRFCPKMYQAISHRGSLKNKGFLTSEFLRGVFAFGSFLGPIFIQMSDRFGPKRKEELFSYLRSLPVNLQFFVELRHHDWFANQGIRKELFGTLQSMNMGAVITDTAGRRDCCHMQLSVPKAFIRFVGNSLHPTDFTRIDDWVKRIQIWLKQGLRDLYFFIHMHEEMYSPDLSAYLVDRLNSVCGLQLQKPLL